MAVYYVFVVCWMEVLGELAADGMGANSCPGTWVVGAIAKVFCGGSTLVGRVVSAPRAVNHTLVVPGEVARVGLRTVWGDSWCRPIHLDDSW